MTTKINIEKKLNKEVSNLINESPAAYLPIRAKHNLTYDDFLSDKMLIIAAIRKGIPYSLFNLIQIFAPFSENDWAGFLDISTKSLHRYKLSSTPFKPSQSEKIIEIAEVMNIGLDVFGNMPKFKLWLDTPNFTMGNMMPIELLKDSYGKELVISELIRINHGILV